MRKLTGKWLTIDTLVLSFTLLLLVGSYCAFPPHSVKVQCPTLSPVDTVIATTGQIAEHNRLLIERILQRQATSTSLFLAREDAEIKVDSSTLRFSQH